MRWRNVSNQAPPRLKKRNGASALLRSTLTAGDLAGIAGEFAWTSRKRPNGCTESDVYSRFEGLSSRKFNRFSGGDLKLLAGRRITAGARRTRTLTERAKTDKLNINPDGMSFYSSGTLEKLHMGRIVSFVGIGIRPLR